LSWPIDVAGRCLIADVSFALLEPSGSQKLLFSSCDSGVR
jgi:hypothetical protein